MDIEAFLATIYGIGGGLGALTYGAAQNSERLRVNRAETMCVNLLTLAYTLYAMWFWYWGIQQLVSHSTDFNFEEFCSKLFS